MPRPRTDDPGRPRSFWLSDRLVEALDRRADEDGVTRSLIVRRALEREVHETVDEG